MHDDHEAASSATAPRLPAATHPGAVRLQVGDLDRSVEFYTRLLGMRVLDRGGSHAGLGSHGDNEALVALHEHAGAAPVPGRGRLGLYHFAILLPDRPALGRFAAHLSAMGVRAGSADHEVSEAFYLQDPDGLGIEVYADRPREEWRYRGKEVEMGTRPLDLADLVRAADGQSWTAMPVGSRIGHVHLHVADLEAAAAFYVDALGFEPTLRAYPGALFLSAGGYHHHLGLNTWAGFGARPPGEGEARLLDWSLVLPRVGDAEAAAERIRAAGHPVERSDGAWAAVDPWGTSVRLRGEM